MSFANICSSALLGAVLLLPSSVLANTLELFQGEQEFGVNNAVSRGEAPMPIVVANADSEGAVAPADVAPPKSATEVVPPAEGELDAPKKAKEAKKPVDPKDFKIRAAASERREGPAGAYGRKHLEPGGICDEAKADALKQATEYCEKASTTVDEETLKFGDCWIGQLPTRNRVSLRLLGRCN